MEELRRLIQLVHAIASQERVKVYLVGGLVRDLIRGQPFRDVDVDLVAVRPAESFIQALGVALEGEVRHFPSFLTAKILNPRAFLTFAEIDLATARTEQYVTRGALPAVRPADTIEEDLSRRDFTMNALAVEVGRYLDIEPAAHSSSVQSVVVDPNGGVGDLRANLLRILHAESFQDDPTRMFRGCRYAGRFQAAFAHDTETALSRCSTVECFRSISLQRRVAEFEHIFEEPKMTPVIEVLLNYNVLSAAELVANAYAAKLRATAQTVDALHGVGASTRRDLALLFLASVDGAGEAFLKNIGIPRARRAAIVAQYDFAQAQTRPQHGAAGAILALLEEGPRAQIARDELARSGIELK